MLGDDEESEHHDYAALNPGQVLALFEKKVQTWDRWCHLGLDECSRSEGNQLAILLGITPNLAAPMPTNNCYLLLIVRAEASAACGTQMWIRYGTPEQFCNKKEAIAELNSLHREVISDLADEDSRLTALAV